MPDDSLPFVPGERFLDTFLTEAGWVTVEAEVEENGSRLLLRELGIFPLDQPDLKVSLKDLLRIRAELEASARMQGYTEFVMSGRRLGGAYLGHMAEVRRRIR